MVKWWRGLGAREAAPTHKRCPPGGPGAVNLGFSSGLAYGLSSGFPSWAIGSVTRIRAHALVRAGKRWLTRSRPFAVHRSHETVPMRLYL